MGPKKIITAKESTSQNNEISKKKIPVSAAHSKALPQNIKENTSTMKKSATTCSLNVPSHITSTKKSQIPQSTSIRQSKKISQSNTAVNQTKSNTRSSVSLSKSQVITQKKSFVVPGKTTSANREKNQNVKEKVDVVKPVSKNKLTSKTESRLSMPIVHPVALIKDGSKQFKEKCEIRNEPNESLTTTSVSQSLLGHITEVIDAPLILSDGQGDATPDHIEILKELADTNSISCISNENNTLCGFKEAENEIPADMLGDKNMSLQTIITVDVRDFSEDLEKSRLNINDFNSYDNYGMSLKNYVPGVKNDGFPSLMVESSDIFNPYTSSSYYPELINSNVNDDDKILLGASENIVNSQSRVLLSPIIINENLKISPSIINENSNLRGEIQLNNSIGEVNNLGESSRVMKESISATTMESFDRKTFILEKPFEILGMSNDSWNVAMPDCTVLEKDTFPITQEYLSPNYEKSNLVIKQGDGVDENVSEKMSTETTNQTIPEQEITDGNSIQITLDKTGVMKNTYEMTETLLQTLIDEKEDIFGPVDTLEILNLDNISKSVNETLDMTNDILRNFLPTQDSPLEKISIYDDLNDEFASESEEIEPSIELNNCVWMDYKMPLNKPKFDDGSEIWILDEETDESSPEEIENQDPIVFLEPDEQEWVITETKFDELRKCLDECREEAESARLEVNRLASRNAHGLLDKDKHSSKYLRNNDMKQNNVFSNSSEKNLDQTNNYANFDQHKSHLALNTSVVEDDLDYYSVSSGDELSDTEVKTTSNDAKPQKSFLSFGKSCVKTKKKNEKKVLLSFFNFFK